MTDLATYRLTIANRHGEPGERTETLTGTLAAVERRAGAMWNDHPAVVMPDRGWTLRVRKVLAPVGGRRQREKLSRILFQIG
ncbi:hypothetical protein MARCHEWKA_01320 [Brevundimonas phage vB_BpoS-Marchewka]|uniref:Uncharacterized protein n=1 Tax=Brevundimonas phage vB_BpoS-Marchewka TaxID=2948604 RepID=A0A9E7N4B0_9CAUD|nr:hypothetical protein MARCHEWKA_01320 [Brevundimonas phage vB_BpoS-Marchewka]